jgi:hypothetical protein
MTRILALLFVLFLLGGCQSSGVVDSEPLFSNIGLTHHHKELILKDIPLPEDFVLLPDSFYYATPSFRYGELQYRGSLSVDDLYFYYKKQMVSMGWESQSLKQFETNARLSFSKGEEACTILLKEGSSLSDMKIIVEQKKS